MPNPSRHKTAMDALAILDAAMLERLLRLATRDKGGTSQNASNGYLPLVPDVSHSDVAGLRTAEQSYGDSWKKRGGVDTFNMLTRKWDRVEKRLSSASTDAAGQPASPYDIFEHLSADTAASGLIDDVRDLRRYLMLVEGEVAARRRSGHPDSGRGYLDELEAISTSDVREIEEKEKTYGSSWKARGGIAAFMMLARKWDRIVQCVSSALPGAPSSQPPPSRENILEYAMRDRRSEGILDDVKDLRRYLLLVEAEMVARGKIAIGTSRDNKG